MITVREVPGRHGGSCGLGGEDASEYRLTNTVSAEGWRGGEAFTARTEGNTVEVRSDRTPQPAREGVAQATGSLARHE